MTVIQNEHLEETTALAVHSTVSEQTRNYWVTRWLVTVGGIPIPVGVGNSVGNLRLCYQIRE